MVKHLYKDFLRNNDSYKKSQTVWEELFFALANKNKIKYKRRLNYFYADGSEALDGNPIWDCQIDSLKKSIRIIQEEAIHSEVVISAWVKDYEDENDILYHELVISLELSERAKDIAEELMKLWVIDDLPPKEMEDCINNKTNAILDKVAKKSDLEVLLHSFRTVALSEREKGTYFEELILTYFRNEANYKDFYDVVWHYSDWAREQGLDARDVGIDLVAKTNGTNEYHAISVSFMLRITKSRSLILIVSLQLRGKNHLATESLSPLQTIGANTQNLLS